MTGRRLGHTLVAALLLIPVSAGCASGNTGGGASSAPTGAHINVENFSFEPPVTAITAGTTVTWRFHDMAAHNVAADDKSFNSPNLRSNEVFSHTFTHAGTHPYKCTLHQYMTGEIIVK